MQEPDIPPLFQTISKAESLLSFFGDEVPTDAISDKSYYQYRCRRKCRSFFLLDKIIISCFNIKRSIITADEKIVQVLEAERSAVLSRRRERFHTTCLS